MKTSAVAPSNIAFIKYWGKKDEVLRLPENPSISMNLSNLLTTTTVEFSDQYAQDLADQRVIQHVERVRKLANIKLKAKVVTKNNFPSGVGLSSSASGFAALTLAATKAAGLNLSEKDLSILARQGSGSACRSIPDGFVEWEDTYGVSLFPPDHWELIDVVVVVSEEKKEVATAAGQKLAKSSPFYSTRLNKIGDKVKLCKKYLQEKDFTRLGELSEQEALEMHAIMITSTPALLYWTTGTLTLMKLVKKWRGEGLEVYFTINTGQNIHLLCQRNNLEKLVAKLKNLPEVQDITINTPAVGARITDQHLF